MLPVFYINILQLMVLIVMWEFLIKLLDALKNVKWKTVWKEIMKIPDPLKYVLVVSLMSWAFYFSYQKYTRITDVQDIEAEVDELNKKVKDFVEVDQFIYDIETILQYLQILDAAQYYNYKEQDEFINALNRYFKKHDPDDQIINDLNAINRRNDMQFEMLQEHFKANIKIHKILEQHQMVSAHDTESRLHQSTLIPDESK